MKLNLVRVVEHKRLVKDQIYMNIHVHVYFQVLLHLYVFFNHPGWTLLHHWYLLVILIDEVEDPHNGKEMHASEWWKILDIIDGWDNDISDYADENDSDGDEDYQPRQDQSSGNSDSADDSNQSFVPVVVQYRRPSPDVTSSQSTSTTSSASKPQSSTSRGKAKVPKPTYNWKKCHFQPPDCTFLGPSEDIDF